MTQSLTSLTGSDFDYEYREIPQFCSPENLERYTASTRQKFGLIARSFDDVLHTQWVVRSYLALKFILGATILLSSARHAEAENLKVTLPYLKYYSLLNCSRAFVLMSPEYDWDAAKSIKMNHSNIINRTVSALRRLNSNAEMDWGVILQAARDQREVFSYRFPGTGLAIFKDGLLHLDKVESLSRFLAELAQFNSACLESAVRKKSQDEFKLVENVDSWRAMTYEIEGEDLIDNDDWYQVGRLSRRHSRPLPLCVFATHGLLEDFFGAWFADGSDEHGFNPDEHWSLLLEGL